MADSMTYVMIGVCVLLTDLNLWLLLVASYQKLSQYFNG